VGHGAFGQLAEDTLGPLLVGEEREGLGQLLSALGEQGGGLE